jgi:hypothetical protein
MQLTCHSFHGSKRHPILMPVCQMNKKTITHNHTEQCWLSNVQHFGLSTSHHQAQVTHIFIKKCIYCKIVIVEPVDLKDHHNISNTLDGTGMLGLWEQQLVTCHLVQYFDYGTWQGQRKPATKIFDLSVLIFGSCFYVYLS